MIQALLLLFITALFSPAHAMEAVVLEDIKSTTLPGNRVQITLSASGPLMPPTSFTTDHPARIALDFTGMSSGLKKKTLPISVGMARSITAIEAGSRTRIVINLVTAVPYNISLDGNQAIITIEGGNTIADQPPAAPRSAPSQGTTASYARSTPRARAIENIDFRRGNAGEGRIMITLSDPGTLVDLREEGGHIVVEFLDTTLPQPLTRKYDVTDFATPVQTVEASPSDNNVKIAIFPVGNYEHLAYQTDQLYTVEVRPLTRAQKEKMEQDKAIFTGDRLSLNFQDIEVRSVLQLLADFTGLNMVTSDTVKGRITLRLKNVPWDQALDIILKTKGLSMRRTDKVILVAPTEEIAAREKLILESERQIEELAPLRSEFIQINYAKAADLATLLKGEENNLLSERGNVTIDERTNTLLVQDTSSKLEEVRSLVELLDIPIRQVLIESRVVIANNDFAKDIGVRLGFSRANITKSNEIEIAGGLPGHISNNIYDSGQHINTAVGIENPATSGNRALQVNLPQTLSATRGGAVNLLIGKLASYLLNLELSAMQQEGRGELVASPRVITSDQNKAVIKQGLEIPYEVRSSSGATTIAFKEALLKLEVTPHITPDDRIIMDLVINKDNPDYTRALLGIPPIDRRSVETTVLVDNGETVVLGGVFERDKVENIERVPFFGDLPYVGFMFKQRFEKDDNKELLIFVTPRILKDTLSIR
ncbi:MAG: type IV pilus secretin PilQ [Candidatus Polarisedimenticolaceae bacterium]|nr:type IV pilus secretin PilQ [Candidatus Polarisedimenticolaceae bacterium]